RQAFATIHPIDTGVVVGGLAVAAALATVTVTWAARSFGRSVA
ncbi:MAG: hypothetical protein JWL78_867, partial [Chloroflexi bacterium]|nr:hypothetical protein [Chloroflexota bacterium]